MAYKFHGPVDEIGDTKSKRPILFLIPGYTGDKTKLYVANAMNTSFQRGYDVILINHRGLGGIKISTPKLYSAASQQDAEEVIDQIALKYPNRKLFALSVSLGSNLLVNLMGFQGKHCKLTAAAAFVPPIKFDGVRLRTQLNGYYGRVLAKSMKRLLGLHHEVMAPYLKASFNIDITKFWEDNPKMIIHEFDEKISTKLWGYDNLADLYDSSSCYRRIPNVEKPLFFFRSCDDPVMDQYEDPGIWFKDNHNILLGTTQYGGHGGYMEHLFTFETYWVKPCLDFLETFVEHW